MAFRVPTFNLQVSIWRTVTMPPVGPAAVLTQGNLSPGRRTMMLTGNAMTELLLPPGTDVRAAQNSGVSDTAEVPRGSGRFYKVMGVEDVAKGFANEYRLAYLLPGPIWPVPYP